MAQTVDPLAQSSMLLSTWLSSLTLVEQKIKTVALALQTAGQNLVVSGAVRLPQSVPPVPARMPRAISRPQNAVQAKPPVVPVAQPLVRQAQPSRRAAPRKPVAHIASLTGQVKTHPVSPVVKPLPQTAKSSLLNLLSTIGNVINLGATIGSASLKHVVAFDTRLNALATSLDVGKQGAKALHNELLSLSTRVPVPLDELLQVAELAGNAELAVANLPGFLENAATLSRASGASFIETSTALLGMKDPAGQALRALQELEQNGHLPALPESADDAVQLFSNSVSGLGLTMGTALLPPLCSLLNTITPYLAGLASLVSEHETLASIVLGGIAGFVTLSAGMALVGSISGMLGTVWAGLGSGLSVLTGLLGLHTTATGASTTAQSTSLVTVWRGVAAWVSHTAAMTANGAASLAATTKTGLVTAGQWLLNTAFLACPLTWIVGGMAALVAGMVYLYNTCEPVRAVFDTVFTFIGEKLGWVWDKLKTVGNAFSTVGSWVGLNDDEHNATLTTGAAVTAIPPLSATASVVSALASPNPLNPAQSMLAMPDLPSVPPMPDLFFQKPNGGQGFGAAPPTSSVQGIPGTTSGGMGQAVNASFSFSINGVSDADFTQRVINALQLRRADFERLLSGIVSEQQRLAYGS